MKKNINNNRGFTLVELLAVIVILAIVVGITMMTIIPTLSNSKTKSFDIAVQTIKTYIQDQYNMVPLFPEMRSETYNPAIAEVSCTDDSNNPCKDNVDDDNDTNLLNATEYDKNIQEIKWTIQSGKVTIICVTAKDGGEYEQSETYAPCLNSISKQSLVKPSTSSSISVLPQPSKQVSKY